MTNHSPYRPGAGFMPQYLAGREAELARAEEILDALSAQLPTKSVIYSGLRGVGKTVLLNQIESMADDRDILYEHMEIDAKDDFISLLVSAAKSFLRKISLKQKAASLVEGVLEALRSLSLSFDPKDNTFSLSMEERELYMSGNLTQSLTDVFVLLGKAARKSECAVCFFLDEIQFMKKDELTALIAALHRTNQLALPIMVIGAGLPKVFKLVGDAKSYAERLFDYHEIGSLTPESAAKAIIVPAESRGIRYDADAVNKIVSITQGYPFFVQQFCDLVWKTHQNGRITLENVTRTEPVYHAELDRGFFQVRFERCTAREKEFLYAMVHCGALPCTISDIAKNLHTEVSSISPLRAQLINKGMIYAVQHSELDFTVPDFDAFLTRREDT